MAENTEKESVKVLRECIDLQLKKSNDYQNPNSIIKQADYYPSGCLTILEIMHAKMLRMRSVMEAMQNDPNYAPNFESLADSAKDLINYSSFFVSYSRGQMEGQDNTRDFLNRKSLQKELENAIDELNKKETRAIADFDRDITSGYITANTDGNNKPAAASSYPEMKVDISAIKEAASKKAIPADYGIVEFTDKNGRKYD